ncbi:hypothetical protein PDESU_00082 [Pontiella desulfatans]|uniref:Uncharacterized protein n=2 Tax=Pontiella desulfatans TaxID=2750659 RepID=A0A6C2TV95_PONDE|nr:hypothetical protein PDESU_00082 [Pontiella desulfatans]
MIDLNLVHVGDSITGTAVDSLYGNFSVQGGLNGSLHTLHLISDTDPSNFSVGDVHYIAIRIAEFTSTTMEGIVEIGRFGYGSRLDGTWSGYKE